MEGRRDQSNYEVAPDEAQERSAPFQRFEQHLRRTLISGFLVLIPLFVTVVILRFVFVYVDDLLRPSIRRAELDWLDFPGVGVIGVLIVLYLVGSLASWQGGRRAINWQGEIFSRIPVVKTIYGVARQATDALSSPLGHHYSRVVFVQWPRVGFRALGFVTGHTRSAEGKQLVAVYIPTVPNPTSGNLAFIAEEEVIESTLSIEDAMKIVFSGGIVMPDASDSSQLAQSVDVPREEQGVGTDSLES